MPHKLNTFHIISGKWRGRKLHFAPNLPIRPTTAVIRETLFNWLAPIIKDASCLDLFAGSGALGFEAISRGAKKVIMVDKEPKVIKNLQQNAALLNANNMDFICAEFSPHWQHKFQEKFDLVFLDPPFHQGLIKPCCQWLEENNYLKKNTLIYIEAEKELDPLPIPALWSLYRNKKRGAVSYNLCKI